MRLRNILIKSRTPCRKALYAARWSTYDSRRFRYPQSNPELRLLHPVRDTGFNTQDYE